MPAPPGGRDQIRPLPFQPQATVAAVNAGARTFDWRVEADVCRSEPGISRTRRPVAALAVAPAGERLHFTMFAIFVLAVRSRTEILLLTPFAT